ncbi:MAG: phenylacetate-CoA oxygenase subunit PaaC [Armatimonadetes bacterium]|nr:phenylacetate-CoA oxygenase subunit PaaC [Armatimonadota bacterium]
MSSISDIAPPALRNALAGYLLSIADDELILGHRHSEWTGFAPDIESDVALSSIAQEEIGHARLFYERVGELAGGDPDTLAFSRPSGEFRNAVLTERANGDWGYSLVRLYLYDRADAARLDALAAGAVSPVSDLAKTLRREEKYHQKYGGEWLRRLATATTDSRTRIQEALNSAWPDALGIFEPMEGIDTLVDARFLAAALDAQTNQWRASVVPMLEELGLTIPDAGEDGVGGRSGRHTDDLRVLLDEMTSVRRMETGAKW